MKLKNSYVVGVMVMWYEVEMLEEYIASCQQMLRGIENRENVTFHFCINMQEYLETCSLPHPQYQDLRRRMEGLVKTLRYRDGVVGTKTEVVVDPAWVEDPEGKEAALVNEPVLSFPNVFIDWKEPEDEFYNIAEYRRDLNHNWCTKVDFVLWGETDSLWPAQTFDVIEKITEYAHGAEKAHRYVIVFSDRKMWDASWHPLEHADFRNLQYIDEEDWILNNPASSKAYMSLEQMNEINSRVDEYEFGYMSYPKFDGSCLVIASDLIKAGANIPHALLHCAEDTAFGEQAQLVMRGKYRQYVVRNILRVHNRRHPRKRSYILGEDNARGQVNKKGDWWPILENESKHNLSILYGSQAPFIKKADMMKRIQQRRT
jgi:hypothetical protein